MRIERFNDVNLTGIAGTEIDIPAGRAAGLSISYYGTNGAGATLALANIGLIRLTYMGEPKVNARPTSIWQYNNFKGGLPPFASAIGGAFRTTFVIPFRFGGLGPDNPDDNVVNIQHGQMRLFLPAAVTAVAAPAAQNVEVALILDPSGNSRYFPYIFDNQHTLTAAYDVRVNGPNVRAMLLQRPVGAATLPVSLQFSMNGQKFLEGPWQMIEDNTNIYNRVEAAAVNAVLAEFGNGNPLSWEGGRYRLLEVGAAPADTQWITEFGAHSVKTSEYLRTNDAAVSDLARFRAASESPGQSMVAPIVSGKVPNSGSTARVTLGVQQAPTDPGTSPTVGPNFETV